MKGWLDAFAMCQSMFCAIPSPLRAWNEDARHRMLLFLPVIGLEIGLLWALLVILLQNQAAILRGAALTLFPCLVTGCIHMDGFMDVTDALRSWRDQARRREILKDSHVGAFAVIGCVLALISLFALMTAWEGSVLPLMLIPVVSRCCSALAVKLLPPMEESQYAHLRAANRGHIAALAIMLSCTIAAGFCFTGMHGWALAGQAICHGLLVRRAFKALGGMNGDISGYAITLSEICGAAICVFL